MNKQLQKVNIVLISDYRLTYELQCTVQYCGANQKVHGSSEQVQWSNIDHRP